MAYRSLGKDAPGRDRNTSVQFEPRPAEDCLVTCRLQPEFHDKLKTYCSDNHIKMSQLVRYLLAKEVNQGA